jgi:hypothetical protein
MGGAGSSYSSVKDPNEVYYTQARIIVEFIQGSFSWEKKEINKREFAIDSARFPWVTQPLVRNIVCEVFTEELEKYECRVVESNGSSNCITSKWTFTILDCKPLH